MVDDAVGNYNARIADFLAHGAIMAHEQMEKFRKINFFSYLIEKLVVSLHVNIMTEGHAPFLKRKR